MREIIKVSQEPVSLETPIGEEEDSPSVTSSRIGLLLRRPTLPRISCWRSRSRVLDSLSGRERRVLELRLGLEDGRARTLEEVGTSST